MSDFQALCSVFLLTALLFLGFLLRRICKLYSVDGDNYIHFVGYRFLSSCPEGYSIKITKFILKRSYTDSFLLLCPEDILGSSYDITLIVKTKEGRYSAAFGKLINFIIPLNEWNI